MAPRLAEPTYRAHNAAMPRRGASPVAFAPQAPLGEPRRCAAPDCGAAGEFRAPRSRHALNEYLWFCLPHVRAYNAAWDYYKGMSANEIEAHLRQDTAWQRPTWPLGRLGARSCFDPEMLRDPLGALHATPLHSARRLRREPTGEQARSIAAPPPELRAALDVLGLEWPVDRSAVRARWQALAKQLHPDANGGDRAAEDRMKDVNRAYSLLRSRLAPSDRMPAPAEATV
jgi:hypothetical protein